MRFLSERDTETIYEAALTILATVGSVVHHGEAVSLLADAGCRVAEDGRVLVPPVLVERARATAPAIVRMYDRDGAPAMDLGGRNAYFGTGADLMHTYDLETGDRRRSTLADVARAAQLVDALPNMDFAMSAAYPNEVVAAHAYVLSFATMLRHTRKPLVVIAEGGRDLEAICGLAGIVRGGPDQLRDRPYFAVYAQPASPLAHPHDSVAKLLVCARAGVPCVYVPAPLTGTTAPITVAGYMALGTAESLLGLVVHQLCRPGAPFVFGHGHAVLDMHSAQSVYNAVEGYAIEMGMVAMAKWLDLPNFANAGTSDAQLVDAQAGLEIGQETLLVMQAGSNLNHNAGYLDFGLTGSLEGIVITDEVVGMTRHLLAGITVDEDALALDVVAAVGPGGHFLDQKHTRRHLRGCQWRPTILNREGREAWRARGSMDLRAQARWKALDVLRGHSPAPLAPEADAALSRALAPFAAGAADQALSPV
jgi:trimethylamine--corrinoid protein Co-methyltransferase